MHSFGTRSASNNFVGFTPEEFAPERVMGTVGINFGSINSGQGFDVTSTVNQILAAEQAIETPWKNQLTSLQAQDTALSKFGTDLATMSTALQALTDFSGVFASKQGA